MAGVAVAAKCMLSCFVLAGSLLACFTGIRMGGGIRARVVSLPPPAPGRVRSRVAVRELPCRRRGVCVYVVRRVRLVVESALRWWCARKEGQRPTRILTLEGFKG
eukprot:scaffold8292_cov120-Isochrysis_galbana.AAC.7